MKHPLDFCCLVNTRISLLKKELVVVKKEEFRLLKEISRLKELIDNA